jgi:hypothetical protein
MAESRAKIKQYPGTTPRTIRTTKRERACEMPLDERARQLADIASGNDDDAAACAAADLSREFPGSPA